MGLLREMGLAIALAVAVVGGTVAQAQSVPEPALFAVRDADSVLYLYGTIHLQRADDDWGGPTAKNALAQADEVWTEIDMGESELGKTQALMMQLGADSQRTLSQRMPEQANALKAAAEKLGVPFAALDRSDPWLASLMLAFADFARSGFDPAAGVDRAIAAEAQRRGAPMRAFETGPQQIGFLNDLPEEVQRQMLRETLDELDAGQATLQQAHQAWSRGDLKMLEDVLIADMPGEWPELYDVMLKGRNSAWTVTLKQELAGAGVDFVAVGAAHLVGPDSVLAMLAAEGFNVERLTPTPE